MGKQPVTNIEPIDPPDLNPPPLTDPKLPPAQPPPPDAPGDDPPPRPVDPVGPDTVKSGTEGTINPAADDRRSLDHQADAQEKKRQAS